MLPRRIMIAATAAASRNPAAYAQKSRLGGITMPNRSSSGSVVRRVFSSSRDPSLLSQSNTNSDETTDNDPGDPDQPRQDDQPKQPQPREPQHGGEQKPQPQQFGADAAKRDESRSQSRSTSSSASPEHKKWRAPFWLPPSSSRRKRNPQHHRHPKQHQHQNQHRHKPRRFRNELLPCRQHLDPGGSMRLPTSDWVQIFGALPMTSLDEILDSIEGILRREVTEPTTRINQRHGGVLDLDAEWNPVEDRNRAPLVGEILDWISRAPGEHRPEFTLDNDADADRNGDGDGDRDSVDGHDDETNNIYNNNNNNNNTQITQIESFRVVKAHVVLSPFGRPTGWNLKLTSPSMVNALLLVASDAHVRGSIRIGWRFANVKEYHPGPIETNPNDTRTMLLVNDTMVRFENCPLDLTEDYLRHLLSRYELTTKGPTIIKWKGRTNDGKAPPLTYVVRFATAAYARAAVREMQGTLLKGQAIRLIQYPRQLL